MPIIPSFDGLSKAAQNSKPVIPTPPPTEDTKVYTPPTSQISAFEQWYTKTQGTEVPSYIIENPYAMINMYIKNNEELQYYQGRDIINNQKDIKALQQQIYNLNKQVDTYVYGFGILTFLNLFFIFLLFYIISMQKKDK